jgi:1-acyl-sn-glycerol-3-phosphate acyltransferase
MKRILWMVLTNLLFVPYGWIKLCWYAGHVDRYTRQQHWKLVKYIDRKAIKGGRIRIRVTGQEHLPPKDGFILYPNHQGLFDVLSIIDICDRPISVVAKKELKDIPFLKQIFACTNSLAMDREDVRQSMGVIMEVGKRVKEGDNFLIFPEGTRSRNKNQLLEFKGGSFKCAVKSKCPIVPVALLDTYKVMDTNSIKPVTVQVHILPPLYYEEYQNMKTTEIAALVHDRIEQVIKENENEDES